MPNVWWVGQGHEKVISATDWALAGVPAVATTIWNLANGWSVNEASLSTQQFALLDGNPEFLTGQTGPRVGVPTPPGTPSDVSAAAFYYEAILALYDEIMTLGPATQGDITAAIEALKGGASGAYDTLIELQNLLEDSEDAIAALVTALAEKQPADADLTAIAALSSAANKMLYATGSGTWALSDLTAFARTMLAATDAATTRLLIGAVGLDTIFAAESADAYIDFSVYPNGDPPAFLPTGQGVDYIMQNIGGPKPQILNGRLAKGTPTGSGVYACYYQAQLDGECNSFYVSWDVDSSDGSTTDGAVCVVPWRNVYEAAGTVVPATPAHITFQTMTNTALWYISDGGGTGASNLKAVKAWTFTPPASDGVAVWDCLCYIDPELGIAYLRLPGPDVATGSRWVTITDVEIASFFTTFFPALPVPTLGSTLAGADVLTVEHFAGANANTARYPRFRSMAGNVRRPARDNLRAIRDYIGSIPVVTHAAPSKTTPADLDEIPALDSATAFSLKRFTWTNIKVALANYIATLALTFTNKTLTNPRVSTLLDTNGNGAANFSPSASAVNYVQFISGATGAPVTIRPTGTDTNAAIYARAKGTGRFGIMDGTTSTKIAEFDVSSVVGTRVFTLPNASTTLVGIDTAQVLTQKSIDGATNTLTNIPISAIPGFTEAVQDAVAALLAQGTNVTLSYDDTGNTLTVSATGGGGGLDAEAVRDAIGVALVGIPPITITVNDAADTITFSTTATANSTDAQLRDRTTHTGVQPVSSINASELTETVQDIVGGMVVEGSGIDVVYNDAGNALSIAGTAAQIGMWSGYLGDGSPAGTDYTFNHGLGSRHVFATYRDKITGQKISIVDDYVVPGSLNSMRAEPDVIWPLNRIQVTVFAYLGADVTAPTAPTVNEVSKTITTIDVSATGSTDNIGIVGYRWWRNGVLVGETTGNTFQYTGLNGSTAYTCGCTTIDLAGNESNIGTTVITTNAPANVAYVSKGDAPRSTTLGAQIAINHNVTDVPNRCLIATVPVSNNGEAWGGESTIDTRILSSQFDGNLDFLGGVNVGPNTQWTGSLLFFGKLNPTVGAHVLTSNIDDAAVDHFLMGQSFLYSGVGAFGTLVKYEPHAAGNLAVAVPDVAVGDMAFGAGVFYAAQATAFNQTLREAMGSATSGGADFLTAGDAAGAGGIINFTATSPNFRAGGGIRLIRAA